MKLKIYQVDAFTDKLFTGNPAAVCPLENWLDDETLQKIAAENNLSETAFFVKKNDKYHLRWMTPRVEVDLCGHATLASAFVLFDVVKKETDKIIFESLSGDLIVTKKDGLITLNFPSRKPNHVEITDHFRSCVDKEISEAYLNKKLMFVLKNEDDVSNAIPNFDEIKKLHSNGLIITAKGKDVDFVSRYFVPQAGIPEDPVTGSAHTVLTPFWAERLGKKMLTAKQVSSRGGELFCEDLGDRVNISGNAVLYSDGEIYL